MSKDALAGRSLIGGGEGESSLKTGSELSWQGSSLNPTSSKKGLAELKKEGNKTCIHSEKNC